MNRKSADTLEFPKILQRLAGYTSFSASHELALELAPTPDLDAAGELMQETTEARELLENKSHITFGGVRDVRDQALSCQRGIILDPITLLDIHSTLRRATALRRMLIKLDNQFPLLGEIADHLDDCPALQDEITRILSDDGEVKDSASPRLASIRQQLRTVFNRLQSKINNIVSNSDNAQYLQESLVTQRSGRYVIPIKAEFKGRIPGVVHDQSSSGATLFIEPLATLEINNEYRELQLEEENEIRRILTALCELIGQEADAIVMTVETLAYLDLVFAKAKYAEDITAQPVALVPFAPRQDSPHPGGTIRLLQARHPLLDPQQVVPIDVEFDDETFMLVITGPNTGGKTVALKTVGLLTLMSQCGLHLPVETGSALSVFEDVYADIGDEQSIEQSLSTFSSHMTNFIDILDRANPRSLIILDELGAGTDPVEGSALARAILSVLLERGITTMVTTHHPELKVFGYENPGVRNASVEFDLETLAPTYRLTIGLPGRSNALAIASRLGLSEDIIERARSMVATEELQVDDLLEDIRKTRENTRLSYERTRDNEAETNRLRQELAERLDSIEDERRRVLAEARQQAEEELEDLRAEIRELRRLLQSAGQPLDAIQQVEKGAKTLAERAPDAPRPLERPTDTGQDRKPRLGESVYVTTLRSQGEVTEVDENEVEVMVGSLRVRAKLDDIEFRNRSERRQAQAIERQQAEQTQRYSREPAKSPGLELDLRGLRVEEALPKVDDYLDSAYMAALPFVRIIHGKGTGALRTAVRDALRDHPLVNSYKRGSGKEGGDGVTVVHLVERG